MKPNGPWPWELIFCALISITILIMIFIAPDPLREFGAFMDLALIFFFPGYALALALFPDKDRISFSKRLILIIIFSSILAGLAGLTLNLTPRGLQPASLAFSLAILSLVLTLAAYLRWSALSRRKRFVMQYGIARKTLRNRRQRDELPGITLVLLGLILIVAVSAFALSSNHFLFKNSVTGYISTNISKTDGNRLISSNYSGNKSDPTREGDRFIVLGTAIESYLGNKSGQGSASSHPNPAGYKKEQENEKSDQSSARKTHEEISKTTGQVSEYSEKSSEFSPTNVNYGSSETIDSSKETKATIQTAGIHRPDRTMNEIDGLKPPQEFKGDRILPPQQITAQGDGKISITESQDRVQSSNYDSGYAMSAEPNKIYAASGSSSVTQVNAQTMESNNPIVGQEGAILVEKKEESMGTNMDSGLNQGSLGTGSKELNDQSVSSAVEADASEKDSSSKKTESLAENKLDNKMENEIDSWMSSRGSSASNKDQKSYQSDNIQYVKKGSTGKAILGRQANSNTVLGSESQTPMRLG